MNHDERHHERQSKPKDDGYGGLKKKTTKPYTSQQLLKTLDDLHRAFSHTQSFCWDGEHEAQFKRIKEIIRDYAGSIL